MKLTLKYQNLKLYEAYEKLFNLSIEQDKLLKEIKTTKSAGYQSIHLEDTDLPKGLILYQLQTTFGTQTRKMLRIE